jgi:hypothetical protein
LAYLLTALFGFSAVAPALLADETSNLPACCRRFGQHHCGLLAGDSGVPSFKGVCADYSQRLPAAVSPSSAGAPGTSRSPIELTFAFAPSQARQLFRAQISPESAHPKRGPPRLFL